MVKSSPPLLRCVRGESKSQIFLGLEIFVDWTLMRAVLVVPLIWWDMMVRHPSTFCLLVLNVSRKLTRIDCRFALLDYSGPWNCVVVVWCCLISSSIFFCLPIAFDDAPLVSQFSHLEVIHHAQCGTTLWQRRELGRLWICFQRVRITLVLGLSSLGIWIRTL